MEIKSQVSVASSSRVEDWLGTRVLDHFTMESDNVRFHPGAESINCKINSLPAEVIMEIFSRVSTVDLENLRYVCKLWRNILKSPLFRSLHSSHSSLKPNDNKVVILKQRSEMSFVDLRDKTSPRETTIDMPYVSDLSRYDIIGSCNGLLCLGSKYHRFILVVNPFTHQYELLPKLPRYVGCILLWGFGIDPITNLFKVMVARGDHVRYREVVVCDLGSGKSLSWRNIGVETSGYSRYSSESPGCFVSGRLHWTHRGRVDKIISFDLADEKFRLVPKPDGVGTKFDLFVLRGSLCIFYKYASMTSRFAIWIMKEYGVQESWVKELDAKPLIPRSLTSHLDENQVMLTCRGLGSVHDGEVLLKCKRRKCEEAFLSYYDPAWDELKLLRVKRLSSFRNGMILHTASLSWI